MRGYPLAYVAKESTLYTYESTKKKPWKMTDREIFNALCDAGQDGDYCKECGLCEYGAEYIRRGFKGKRKKRRY